MNLNIETNLDALLQGATLNNIGQNATNFGILQSSKSKQISEAIKANQNAASAKASQYLEATHFASSVASGVEGPRNISNQILVEPLKAISPDSVVNNGIASNSTMAKAFVKKAQEVVDKASKLSQKPENVSNQEVRDCLKSIGTKCATIAEVQANQAELAHGSSLHASFNSQTIAANALNLHSDSTILARTPHMGVNTQDYHVQANGSVAVVSDTHMNQTRQKVSITDGTSFSQMRTGLTVATEVLDNVSRSMRNTGTETYTSMGKVHQSIGDESLSSISGGNMSHTAYGSIDQRAAESISIVAAPSNAISEVPEVHGGDDAKDATKKAEPPTSGQVLIMAGDGQAQSSSFGLSNLGAITSSTGNSAMTAAGMSVVSGLNGAAVVSTNMSYIGTASSGMLNFGGRSYINTIPGIIPPLTPAAPPVLPTLPTLPRLVTEDLESCLPKELTCKGGACDKDPYKDPNSSSTDVPDSYSPQLTPSNQSGRASQPKEQARQLGPSRVNTIPGSAPAKLPGISASDSADKTQAAGVTNASGYSALDNAGLSGAALNIYLEKVDDSSAKALVDIIHEQAGTVSNLLNSQDVITSLGLDASILAANITPQILNASLAGVVPAAAVAEFNDPALFSALSRVSRDSLDNLKASDFPTSIDPETVNKAIKLLTAYPDSISKIKEILDTITALPAIGFLEMLTSLISSFKIPGLSNIANAVTTASQIPNIVSSGNPSRILGLVSDLASTAGLNIQPLQSILSNKGLQGLGQSILSGDVNGITSSVKGLLLSEVSKVLPSELVSIAPTIESLISGIKAGDQIDSNQLINTISGAISSLTGSNDIAQATSIFNNLQGLIKNASSGDITNLLLGGNAQSLVTSLLGSKNAGYITSAIGLIEKSVGTVQALSLVPNLLEGISCFNIASIEQVSSVLSCLDLFNKIKDLLDTNLGDSNIPKGVRAARTVEQLPRMVQAVNSIKNKNKAKKIVTSSTSMEYVDTDIPDLPPELEDIIINASIPYNLDPCFSIPRLTLAQADVQVISTNKNQITFKFNNPELFQTSLSLIPKEGDLIQLRVEGFFDSSNELLVPYQTDYQYTPTTYNFTITELDLEQNIGIAVVNYQSTSLVLEDSSGVLYEYSPYSIGIQLNPKIIESYLLS